jgi:alpha-galactosidase
VTGIVLVGAGSVEFTRNLLGDFLSYPELHDAGIVLHDRTSDRLPAFNTYLRDLGLSV